MLIYPIYTKDKGLKCRKWFYGDAAFKRATNAKKENETVYEVELVFEGVLSNRVEYGFAVGRAKD